jgi:hypothetical protein
MIDVILICLGFVFATLFYKWVEKKSDSVERHYYEYDLWDWMAENDVNLYARCRPHYHTDEIRKILNEVTGLEILDSDLISESEEKYLLALKQLKRAQVK